MPAGMLAWILSGTAVVTVATVVLLFRLWLRARNIAKTIDRIAPALVEPHEFFELVELSGADSHFMERHGPMLKTCEVLQRAESGRLDVSGYVGRPVASARWLRHSDLLRALRSAIRHWEMGAAPKGGRFVFAFEEPVGEGFLRGGGGLIRTCLAVVVLRRGSILTAYPLLMPVSQNRALDGTDLQPELTAIEAIPQQSDPAALPPPPVTPSPDRDAS